MNCWNCNAREGKSWPIHLFWGKGSVGANQPSEFAQFGQFARDCGVEAIGINGGPGQSVYIPRDLQWGGTWKPEEFTPERVERISGFYRDDPGFVFVNVDGEQSAPPAEWPEGIRKVKERFPSLLLLVNNPAWNVRYYEGVCAVFGKDFFDGTVNPFRPWGRDRATLDWAWWCAFARAQSVWTWLSPQLVNDGGNPIPLETLKKVMWLSQQMNAVHLCVWGADRAAKWTDSIRKPIAAAIMMPPDVTDYPYLDGTQKILLAQPHGDRPQRVLCHMAIWKGRIPVLVREPGPGVWENFTQACDGDTVKAEKLKNACSWFYDIGSPHKIDEAELIRVEKECAA